MVRAVDGVSFGIERGELVGYLGPNGAGKSTTIKMLTGILVPTAGEVPVDGRVPWRQRREHVAHIGVVFGQRTSLWWDLPVVESFDLLRHIYHVPDDASRETWRCLTKCWSLASSSTRRCASSPWGSGCAATWRPRCCTIRAAFPRRAHHRAGCGGQGTHPRVHRRSTASVARRLS